MRYWTSFVLCFTFLANSIYSQVSGNKYENQNCEYIHFLGNTLVDFMLIEEQGGNIAIKYRGIGVYRIEDEHLIIEIGDFKNAAMLFPKIDTDSICNAYELKISGTDEYKIEILHGGVIQLVGPILETPEKLSRKDYFKSFFKTLPWNWNFRNEQQWHYPRIRVLTRR